MVHNNKGTHIVTDDYGLLGPLHSLHTYNTYGTHYTNGTQINYTRCTAHTIKKNIH